MRDAAVRVAADRGISQEVVPGRVVVRDRGSGEWGSAVALALGAGAGVGARELGEGIASILRDNPLVTAAWVAEPGFVNLRVCHTAAVPRIVAEDFAFPDIVPIRWDVLAKRSIVVRDGARLVARDGKEFAGLVGRDTARFALQRGGGDIDIAPWLRDDIHNPWYCVQYAHARTVGIRDNSAVFALADIGPTYSGLRAPTDRALVGRISQFTLVMRDFPRMPQRLTRYLTDLADEFLRWQADRSAPVLPWADDPVTGVHAARMRLVEVTGRVVARGLAALGIAAAQHM